MILKLLRTIDCDALLARAKALRHGMSCELDLPGAREAFQNPEIVGGRNYHASITFEDGKVWLARFKLPNHTDVPLEEKNFDRRSEFATYRFLGRTSVPALEAYEYADDGDASNAVGAGYILFEKLFGKPMPWYDAREDRKVRFSPQRADIYVELARYPFGQLGRLRPGSMTEAPEVGPAFFDYDPTRKPVARGPFEHPDDYYQAIVERGIHLMKTRQMAISAPVDLYLVYRALLDHLPSQDSHEQGSPFFLQHVGTRSDNFLVDDNYNLTSIIDWDFAILAPKSSAFQSPLLVNDLGLLLKEGQLVLSEDELRFTRILREWNKRDDLASLAAQKLFLGFQECIKTDSSHWVFVQTFSVWWKAVTGTETFDWNTWRIEALDKYGDGGMS